MSGLRPEHGGSGDLRAVEVQDRQHRPVPGRVDEGDALPRPFQRAGLGLAVADHGDGQQVRVVHHRAEGVHQGVPQLASLVDGAGRGHRHVAGDATGSGELPEQPLDAGPVLGDGRVGLGVAALQVAGGHQSGATVTGAGDVDALLAGVLDQPVDVGVDEGETGTGAPVPEQPRLDLVPGQRLAEQRVVLEVDLTDGQVVVGPPPGVDRGDLGLGGRRQNGLVGGVGLR